MVANDECKTSSDGEESAGQTRYRMEIDLDLRFLHEFLWKFGTICGNHIGTSNKNNGSLSGDYRGHDMDHSGALEMQANSGADDGMAMVFRNRQMIAGGSR